MKVIILIGWISLIVSTSQAFFYGSRIYSESNYCHDNQYVYFNSQESCKKFSVYCSNDLKAGPLREVETIYISETEKIQRLYLFPNYYDIPQCHDKERKQAKFIQSYRFAYSDEVSTITNLLEQNISYIALYGIKRVIPKSIMEESYTTLSRSTPIYKVGPVPFRPEDDNYFEVIATGGEYGGGGIHTSSVHLSVFESEIEFWKEETEKESKKEDENKLEGIEI